MDRAWKRRCDSRRRRDRARRFGHSSARFLLALASLGERPSALDGGSRLRERPMDELIAALSSLGASVETSGPRVWPLRAGGTKVHGGGVTLSGARSSQFASALLLAASSFEHGVRLDVASPRVSFAYVSLTLAILEEFGAVVVTEGDAGFCVPRQRLRPASVAIEGDYSSASYLFAAAAILGGRVRVRGLRWPSAQPDARFLDDLRSVGCRVSADASGVLVEGSGTIAGVFVGPGGRARSRPDGRGVGAVRGRALRALRPPAPDAQGVGPAPRRSRANLTRLGARVEVHGGVLSVDPPAKADLLGAPIVVRDDHRIAMAFAIAGLRIPGTTIDDPGAVAKSYPRFWEDVAELVRTGS